jgi:hypothetical protein
VIALAVAVFLPYVRPAEERTPDRDTRGRTLAAVAAPSIAFLVVWMAICWYDTGDPLVFLSAKSAWVEYTLWEAPTYLPATLHVLMAVVLVLPFALRLRRQPAGWIAFVALTVLPSLVLGVVGLGRYTVQCFPLAIAAGAFLDRLGPRAGRLVVVASAAGIVGWALLITRASYVP